MLRICLITKFLFILLLNLGALDVHQGLAVGCHDADREALLKFKHSLSDPSNMLSSWKGKGCCDWEGVGCHNVTAFVIHLHLPNPGYLRAAKLNPSLLELSQLRYLDLSCNDFQGSQIPKFIGSFKYLRYLNLSFSNFGGVVPSQIGNLTRLQILDLSDNGISSDLHWVSTLVSLQYLNFGGSQIIQTNNSIQALHMPHSLRVLYLDHCLYDLDSPLLLDLFSDSTWHSRIQQLDLSDNSLGGTLPYVLANMTSLTYLDLSRIELYGSIPLWLSLENMTSLTYLDLSWNNLNGSIPLWMRNMNFLTYLDLSVNNLNGPMPLWLGNMTSLTYLDLSGNGLNGSIPLLLGNMTSLTYIDLSRNMLNGPIPPWLANMTSLTHLGLSDNGLHGSIPLWLANMTSLTHLGLSDNGLHGSIPLSIRSMRKLDYLDLSFNNFSSIEGGAIMGILGNLCQLISFDLSNNPIGGSIKASHKNFSKCVTYDLENLSLRQNMIRGTLPSWLWDFKYLKYLDLNSNRINGRIPISIGRLFYLEHLDLSYNTLSGALSESHLHNLSRLDYLDLSYNVVEWNISSNWSPPFQLSDLLMASCKIQSQFPRWIVEQNGLINLDISHNQITGRVPYFTSFDLYEVDLSFNLLSGSLEHHDPSAENDTVEISLCQLPILEFLDLERNNISGTICDFWGGGSKDLSYINLSSNKLSGIIPLSMGLLPELAFLKLSNNSLQGRIPSTLSTKSSLEILDLGDNKLVGNIPSNWGGKTLPSLALLRLRGNQLVGSIPPLLCSIDTLQFIDLSFNNLTGGIPHCFGRLHQMESSDVDINAYGPYGYYPFDFYRTTIVLKGEELQYSTTLVFVVSLDLSCNALTGSIPEEITNLSALIGLNLSHNHLTGNIPKKIGAMTSLESLDLSNNNLSGIIPSSLSALTMLSVLNLSYNKLHGQIPTGPQLQTFNDPSVYEGNPGLCGDPLPNKCLTNQGEKRPIQGQEKSDVWEKPLLYLVIMSGFATGFWGVVGSLLLNSRFRFVVFHVVGNVADYLYVKVMIRLNRLRN